MGAWTKQHTERDPNSSKERNNEQRRKKRHASQCKIAGARLEITKAQVKANRDQCQSQPTISHKLTNDLPAQSNSQIDLRADFLSESVSGPIRTLCWIQLGAVLGGQTEIIPGPCWRTMFLLCPERHAKLPCISILVRSLFGTVVERSWAQKWN